MDPGKVIPEPVVGIDLKLLLINPHVLEETCPMVKLLDNITCVKCKNGFNDFTGASRTIVCTHCEQAYPLVANKIPLLFENPLRFVANLYLQYEHYLRQQLLEIKKIDTVSTAGTERVNTLANLKTAIQHNANYIKSIQDELLPHLSPKALTDLLSGRDFIPYTTNWLYLQRDWCWLPEGEQELQTIKDALFKAMSSFPLSQDSVLVVGAGAGRIAWELCEISEHVYATDNALTMAYQFYDLLHDDIDFYEINKNNIFYPADMVRTLRASLYSPDEGRSKTRERQDKLFYFVADALSTPLRDGSVSAIVSVYFTDLVPMKSYLQEIKRLLKPGGIFFHFGPLEYDLPDVSDHLSADEIKSLFISNDFTIHCEQQVLTTHLPSALSMSFRTYNNWTFTAINQAQANQNLEQKITFNSILSIVDGVHYETRGFISLNEENLIETNLVLTSGERYGGAKSVLDILRNINGLRRNHEVIEILSMEYEVSDEASKQAILDVMTVLIQKRILKVIEF